LRKLQEKAVPVPLGLYLHVPFCARSCDFCHFYQEAPRRAELERYLLAMEESLGQLRLPREVDTVFWGGGTPGLLPSEDLRRLGLAVVRANGGCLPREWTVEMAPSTVKADRLETLLEMGVTRFSMGVQTFDAKLLESLGRIHTRSQVDGAIQLFQDFRIENFNLDLIFAIPGQRVEAWERDLQEAVAAGPAHISTYCLTFEEDTALWLRLKRGQVEKTDADEEALFFTRTRTLLEDAGYAQYEVSNYCRPGRACLHNLNTWRMEEWIGVGPSAASQFAGRRWTEPHSLEEWQGRVNGSGKPALDEVILTPTLLQQDCLIFGLRMNAGVDVAEIQRRHGALPASTRQFLERLVEEGLAVRQATLFRLTEAGRLLADRIGEEILGLDETG
jgi:oxygen-independent coproporphyrinogen-3 oxidase